MTSTLRLVWITPDAEQTVVDIARVSSKKAPGEPGEKLLNYLKRNAHWSPFEMASACLEITTTRDIGRQLLRHRSFSFQEFSQRYSEVASLRTDREARGQHPTNRQASTELKDPLLDVWWGMAVGAVAESIERLYREALRRGVAKECARALLPEGLTPTRMYMAGTLRSWLHFVEVRTAEGTQPECAAVAREAERVLAEQCPVIFART